MKRLFAMIMLGFAMLGAPAAHAQLESYRAILSGPNEAVPNDSFGFGKIELLIDRTDNTMRMSMRFQEVVADNLVAHFHCCTPQPLIGTGSVVSALPDLPGFPDYYYYFSGAYNRTFDLLDAATYNPAFINDNGGTVASARDVFLEGLSLERAYFNVHNSRYPDGEIRGFFVMQPVPEPSSWLMLGIGLLGLGAWMRRRSP